MKKLIAGVTCVALLSGCGESDPNDSRACVESYFDTDVSELTERAKERLDRAIDLARSVKLPEAHELADFLENKVSFDKNSDDKAEVMLLQEGTNYKCFELEQTANSTPAFAVFSKSLNAVLLIEKQDQPISPFWGALMTLHEGKHAFSHYQAEGPFNPFEEQETRIFEQRILLETGGAEYRDLLNQTKEIIRNASPAEKISPPEKVMEKVYGKALSEADSRLRAMSVLFHAAFEIIEEDGRAMGQSELEIKKLQQALFTRLESESNP